MERNPELIQGPDMARENGPSSAPRAPLFLIHDGGGTTFAYHCLEPLHRPLYGISNPRYHTGGTFEGGMRGMGRLYASMIRKTCSEPSFPAGKLDLDGRVPVLIGGWSMGGLVAIEVAKALTGDRHVRVVGVLLIETMYPVHARAPTEVYDETLEHLQDVLSKASGNAALSIRAMHDSLVAIRDRTPPVWKGAQAALRPRFSLLRAVSPMPSTPGSKHRHLTDMDRHDRRLGWDRYEAGLFTETVDVKGNHFDMFSFKHIEGVSTAIRRCCDTLEKMGAV
jgi:thioesterase domain-containing protein